MENKSFIRWAKISLILVYLVIIAGATVRMTGSGMGCPDWPKCFGYYIPPTDVQELLWEPNREYKKGQVIIKEEKLWVANKNFTSKDVYDATHWNEYTKRSEEHTSELQSRPHLVCRLLLEKKNPKRIIVLSTTALPIASPLALVGLASSSLSCSSPFSRRLPLIASCFVISSLPVFCQSPPL